MCGVGLTGRQAGVRAQDFLRSLQLIAGHCEELYELRNILVQYSIYII